jgi:malonyl-CoA/methylmalonyl-CoA synthetase
MRSPFLARLEALGQSPRIAVEDDLGSRSFIELHARALHVREALCDGAPSLDGRRIALLAEPGAAWVEAFLGILLAGGVAVPLSPLYPPSELAWFAVDAGADTVILSTALAPCAQELVQGRRVLTTKALADAPEPAGHARRAPEAVAAIAPDATALLLYTSGTTGKPKGAMLTHANLAIQTELLRDAWRIGETDALLHALPLHHLHGLGISLLTALLAGARARMLPRFDARRVWDEIEHRRCSVWMAVPTMYQKLLDLFDAQDEDTRARWAAGAAALRLATSGSAALPVTVAARWEAITSAIPLERFGMTEIGVGMSNPLDPPRRRRGSVGFPLPSVMWRILDDAGLDTETGPGELLIRGPSVFAGYFGRDEATADSFTEGWFRTGDIAERSADGYLRLLGRTSVDILKSGGYKLSALEIEETLRDNPAVAEVAVIGLPDDTWGDRVVAIVVPAPGCADACAPDVLRAWAKARLVAYKVPREILLTSALPRNPMGKVVKPELRRAVLAGEIGGLERA